MERLASVFDGYVVIGDDPLDGSAGDFEDDAIGDFDHKGGVFHFGNGADDAATEQDLAAGSHRVDFLFALLLFALGRPDHHEVEDSEN